MIATLRANTIANQIFEKEPAVKRVESITLSTPMDCNRSRKRVMMYFGG